MIKQLAHLCLHTQDLDATLAFYSDALGLEKAFDFERQGKPFGYYLKLGANTFLEVFEGDPGAVGNINHLCLETDDLDATLARLGEHGIAFTDKKLGADRSWQSWITDPSGVRIELHQYTDQSAQFRGGTCIATW